MTPLTDDELAAIDADLSETDKPQDPIAAGVDPDRAERWAIYDTVTRSYLERSVRTTPPTKKMRADLAKANEVVGFDRGVWHRV